MSEDYGISAIGSGLVPLRLTESQFYASSFYKFSTNYVLEGDLRGGLTKKLQQSVAVLLCPRHAQRLSHTGEVNTH